jgi:hypothetical protein
LRWALPKTGLTLINHICANRRPASFLTVKGPFILSHFLCLGFPGGSFAQFESKI